MPRAVEAIADTHTAANHSARDHTAGAFNAKGAIERHPKAAGIFRLGRLQLGNIQNMLLKGIYPRIACIISANLKYATGLDTVFSKQRHSL
ncbi:hypothetical protein [Shewanella sp. ANA-3]|uniref:hypothetical protein n=1 Tax=Shewanella sp. (strain ANA-3) TaxID=94122 RepID=UPI001FC88DD6|nr:hypothetical protein [Shewanella sp. ANA-3]